MKVPKPLAYHQALRNLLKQMDPAVWNWFGNQQSSPAALEALKFELLKSTYRLTSSGHPRLYGAALQAAEILEIKSPITLYQAQAESQLNAALAMGGQEIHIVFSGDLESILNDQELQALLGHELGHHLLHQADDGDHYRCWDILRSISLQPQPHPAFLHSFRKLSLYTETYCDQVALSVVGQLEPVISVLVKLETGLKSVAAGEFLQQARQVLQRTAGLGGSEGISHPEATIRAAALELAHQGHRNLDEKLAAYIETPCETGQLDLLQQQQLSRMTRALIGQVLAPRAMQTDLMLSHARLYFEDFETDQCRAAPPDRIAQRQRPLWNTPSITNYLSYVLLDFASVDRSLEELPVASALATAEAWQLKESLIPMLRKELKLRKNQVEQCDREKCTILETAHEVH